MEKQAITDALSLKIKCVRQIFIALDDDDEIAALVELWARSSSSHPVGRGPRRFARREIYPRRRHFDRRRLRYVVGRRLDRDQGLGRDIAFWGQFFDTLRAQRIETSMPIIRSGADQGYRKVQLAGAIPVLAQALNVRNSKSSDPASAADMEKIWSFDAPADAGYVRIRAKA